LQDQGHDALTLVQQCVEAVNYYGYNTKIMFSSVRHNEHVRNAINIGVHTITVPLKVLKTLTENSFTDLGTAQFLQDTKLMTVRVGEALNGVNPVVDASVNVKDAIVKMTEFGFGAIVVTEGGTQVKGVFTDGDLRRHLQQEGSGVLDKKLGSFEYKAPISIESDRLLNDAQQLFRQTNVDTILVTDNGKPVGMLDIQDLKA
jgi:signal-transduction protein with cAMP-binding, CBS, and nucleotidyltransferase domain